jgi:hypothetical protein
MRNLQKPSEGVISDGGAGAKISTDFGLEGVVWMRIFWVWRILKGRSGVIVVSVRKFCSSNPIT